MANLDKNEDVSLTWKILGAAESVSRMFLGLGQEADEGVGGVNLDMRESAKRKPEQAFELKQREQLRKAARELKRVTGKLILPGMSPGEDVTAALPKEMRGRFARVRAGLAAAAAAAPSPPLVGGGGGASSSTGQAAEKHRCPSLAAVAGEVVEGSTPELGRFVEHCSRIESTGGWAEIKQELRLEIIAFTQKYAKDLEWGRFKTQQSPASTVAQVAQPQRRQEALAAAAALPPPATGPLGDLLQLGPPAAPGPSRGALPLLPPPPPPKSGVASLI